MHYPPKTITALPECANHDTSLVLLSYPKQPLDFVKCALSDEKCGHVIDSEASVSLRVT